MASELAAVVENVGKCYHVYDKNIDRLRQSLMFGGRKLYREFWALREISFEVRKGDTLGIVGVNGSGKSTLLQLLFGVLNPTVGRIQINGKIGGLLELGAGFNPEETGRENVLINAAILGVPQADIPALFEKVAAFADIGDFLDQPIKVYSSGMAVRLGFALQINVPYDILIIDEALAVGDELFQRKCYAALEKFKGDGGTILFVSHSAGSVKQLCRHAIFLDHGEMIQQGLCKTVVDNYQKFLYMREPERSQFRAELKAGGIAADEVRAQLISESGIPSERRAEIDSSPRPPATVATDSLDQGVDRNPPPAEFEQGLSTQTATYYQSIGAEISNPRIETLDGRQVNILNPQERYRYCYRVKFTAPARHVLFGWLVKSTTGLELGGGAHETFDGCLHEADTGDIYDVTFEFTARLYPALYYLNCGVSGNAGDYDGFLHRVIDAVAFRVRNVYFKLHTGFADLDYRSTVTPATEAATTRVLPTTFSIHRSMAEPAADERVPAPQSVAEME